MRPCSLITSAVQPPPNSTVASFKLPLLQAIEGNMHTEGMLINAEDIYSLNNGSLKDATALFGGGCTAEVISA